MSDVIQTKPANGKTWMQSLNAEERWVRKYVQLANATGVFTITAELTPELAQVLLGKNPDNRKVSKAIVNKYARDIVTGRWEHNGEPIIISDTGELNDGQQRCIAVIETGISITTQMTFGPKRETRRTLDIGKKRKIGEQLGMAKLANGNNLAHAVSIILMMEKYGKISSSQEFRPTPAEVMDWIDQHHEIHECVTEMMKGGSSLKLSRGLLAAMRYTFNRISKEDSDRFFQKLISGANLDVNDPVFRLRKRIIENLMSSAKLPPHEIAALMIKAWNYFRKDKKTFFLARRSKGENAESFPIPE